MPNQEKRISFACGKPWDRGVATNESLTWGEFAEKFKKPFRTTETLAQYQGETKTGKDQLKKANGWFIGCPMQHGQRRNENALPRDLITLDMDSPHPDDLKAIWDGTHWLNQFECIVHSTRSSTPDRPKLRAVILCSSQIEAENYEAVSRIVAKNMDNSMTKCDPRGFTVAQAMYMPTCSQDQPYFFVHNEGMLLNPQWWLDSWPNWQDRTCLPRCPQERELKAKSNAPLKDPAEKAGLLGAFCRAYGIDAAVSEFIPEVYVDRAEVGSEVRYTFAGSSTSNGVSVLHDRFIWSHHASDPYSERMLNAWDMVRLHRFGHLDTNPGRPLSEQESQKEMRKWAQSLPEVQKALVEGELDVSAMFENLEGEEDIELQQAKFEDRFDMDDVTRELLGFEPLAKKHRLDLPPYPGSVKPKPSYAEWIQSLEYDKTGLKVSEANLIKILVHDERLRGCCAWNAFRGEIVYKKEIRNQCEEIPTPVLHNQSDGDLWQPIHTATVRAILSLPAQSGGIGYGMAVPVDKLKAAILVASQHFQFHPVLDHITGELPAWDGVQRVDRLWLDYMGTPDTPYYRETARLFATGAIARLFFPGIQFDNVPILMGLQNIRKSTFVRRLAFNRWAGEFFAPLDNHQLIAEQLSNMWMLEMAEITNLKKSDAEHQKAFVSRTHDRARLAYAERMGEHPRQCVFIGTTNEFEFLIDHENRRFWPIQVSVEKIDTVRIAKECSQFWAEALALFSDAWKRSDPAEGMHFNLSEKAEMEARQIQSSARSQTIYDEALMDMKEFLESPIPLNRLLGKGGFDSEEVDDRQVVRTVTTARQLALEVGDGDFTSRRELNAAVQHAGKTMHRIEGWIPLTEWNLKHGIFNGSGKVKIKDYPRAPAYVRADATGAEIEQGWRPYRIIDSVV